MIPALAFNLGAIILAMVVLWRVSVAIQDASFIDAVWAYGMVGLATITALRLPGFVAGPQGGLILALTAIWGVRLGSHLISRWRRLGRDPRYDKILGGVMKAKGWSFATASLIMVFGMQGPLLWLVSLPAQAGIIADSGAPVSALGWAGAAIALFGIAFETIGDAQLEAFRKDPDSKGKVLDTGLWRYTRHPNYFGDACAWWGIWLLAISAGAPWWTALGPVFLTFTLTRWSGKPMLERSLSKSRPGYADYVRRTSGFIPMPPRKD